MDSFEHDGLHFDVRDAGPRGGNIVVLLHGFPQDPGAWDGVAPRLHRAGLRTLAPQLRGYSPEARPPARSAYTASAWTGDLLALLDTVGTDRAHLVGHGWGGAVVWSAAGRHPERVASAVVLSTPHPSALTRSLVTSSQGLRSWHLALFQLPRLPELLLAHSLHRSLVTSGLPEDAADRYTTRMRQPGTLTGALNWYRGLPASLLGPTPDCPVATTYVWGRNDAALGRVAAETTGRHVTGPYRFVELAAGHWLPETRPREIATVILARVHGRHLE